MLEDSLADCSLDLPSKASAIIPQPTVPCWTYWSSEKGMLYDLYNAPPPGRDPPQAKNNDGVGEVHEESPWAPKLVWEVEDASTEADEKNSARDGDMSAGTIPPPLAGEQQQASNVAFAEINGQAPPVENDGEIVDDDGNAKTMDPNEGIGEDDGHYDPWDNTAHGVRMNQPPEYRSNGLNAFVEETPRGPYPDKKSTKWDVYGNPRDSPRKKTKPIQHVNYDYLEREALVERRCRTSSLINKRNAQFAPTVQETRKRSDHLSLNNPGRAYGMTPAEAPFMNPDPALTSALQGLGNPESLLDVNHGVVRFGLLRKGSNTKY